MLSIFTLLSLLPLTTALSCHDCRWTHERQNDNDCLDTCKGDVCSSWSDAQGNSIQGCLTGMPSLSMGCRTNNANATLCFCNSDEYCNARSLIVGQQSKKLPTTTCFSYVDTPNYSTLPSDGIPTETCQGNACFYTQSHIINMDGQREVQQTADCSLIPQFTFDIQMATQWPGPGAIANTCYLQQVNGNETTLGCMCTGSKCNAKAPLKVTPGNIACHQTHDVLTDDALDEGKMCRGQFCTITKVQDVTLVGKQYRYTKGCLSVTSDRKLNLPTYRSVLGVEQWICDKQYCNENIERANKALPERVVHTGSSMIVGSSLFIVLISALFNVL